MSIGFRKSLFGFNREDVMDYIEKANKDFAKKETELDEKISDLNVTIGEANKRIEELNESRAQLERELKVFNDKNDEIERLSQNIGKLYLVAQANAKSVIENAKESETLAANEVEKNIVSIDEAHRSLDEIRNEIMRTSTEFTKEVENLMSRLNETKEKIAENSEASEKSLEEFDSIYSEITK